MGVFQALSLDFLKRYFPRLYDSVHLDLLRGDVHLRNADIPSAHPFCVSGFPLAVVSGSIVLLSLHVPWTAITTSPVRLTVRSLHVNLAEPPDSQQSAVFDALAAHLRARNHALIRAADDVVAHTPLIRALHKLLPLMLHRVELDLHDIRLTIACANGAVLHLVVDSLITHPSTPSRADLVKTFRISGLSIHLDIHPERPLDVHVPDAELTLTLANACYDIALTLRHALRLSVNASLARVLREIELRRFWWLLAFRQGRPAISVSDDPAAWWIYSVRAVRATHPSRCATRMPPLSRVRDVLRLCVRYHHLQVCSLRAHLSAAELDEVASTEGILHVDMLLMLRAQARNTVVVDRVAAALVEDSWLQWLLFGNRVTAERRQITGDMRAVLAAMEHGGASAANLDTDRNWRKACVSLHVPDLCVVMAGLGDGCDIRVSGSGVVFRTEVESSLASFSVSASVKDVAVFCGSLCLLQRGELYEGAAASRVTAADWLEVRAHKPALEEQVSLSVRLEPTAVAIDLLVVQRMLQHMRNIVDSTRMRMCSALFGDVSSENTSDIPSQRSAQSTVSVAVAVSQLDLLLAHHVSKRTENELGPHGIVLRCREVVVDYKPNGDAIDLHGHSLISVLSCTLDISDSSPGGLGVHERSIQVQAVSDGVRCTSDVVVYLLKNCFSVSADSFDVEVDITKMRPVVQTVLAATDVTREVECLSKTLHANEVGSGALTTSAADTGSQELWSVVERHVDVSSMQFVVQNSVNGLNGDDGFELRVSNVQVCDIPAGFSAFVDEVTLTERKYGGRLCIEPVDRIRQGLVVRAGDGLFSAKNPSFEIFMGDVSLTSTIDSIFELYLLAADLLSILDDIAGRSSHFASDDEVERKAFRLSVMTKRIRLDLAAPFGFLASLSQVSLVWQGALLSGSCERLQLEDTVGFSPRTIVHYEAPGQEEIGNSSDDRTVSFNVGPGFVNVHLCRIHVTVMRSIVDRIRHLMERLQSGFLDQPCGEGIVSDVRRDGKPAGPANNLRLTVQGSKTSIEFAVEPSQGDGARLDILHVIAVLSPTSQVLSIRKLTLLTRSKRASNPVNALAADIPARWSVLLRNMDVDVSNHFANVIPDGDYDPVGYKQTLSITILNRIIIFLAPSQVHTLVNILTQLLQVAAVRPVNSPNSVKHGLTITSHGQADSLTSLPITSRKAVSHVSLQCETHALSVELVSETDDGSVSATIASVELDPASISLKVASEAYNFHVSTSVVTWTATCPSFRVEDRDAKTPASRQVVVETEESWLGLFGASRRTHRQQDVSMGLTVDGISRTENGRTTSSHQIQIKHARVVLSSRLYAEVTQFINLCVSPNLDESTHANAVPVEFIAEKEGRIEKIVTAKVSVHLVEPVIIFFSANPALDDRLLEGRAKSAKVSILLSENGELLQGSLLKFKDLHFFLRCMRDVLDADKMVTNSYDGSESPPSQGPIAIANPRRDSLHGSCESESVLLMKNVTVLLPNKEQEYFLISVPDAILESSLATVTKTIHFLSTIDVGANLEDQAGIFCPPLKIVVSRLVARIRIATTVEVSSSDVSRRNHVVLGLDVSTDVVVANNVELVSGKIQLAADVADERRNLCDHLLSSTPLHFEARVVDQVTLELWTEKFIRVTLSPLTAQTLAGIAMLFVSTGTNPNALSESDIVARPNTSSAGLAASPGIGVRMSIKGVFVCCLAEEPRMQLLKLVLRGLAINAIIPMVANTDGILQISLQDMLLEDSISWKLPRRAGESDGDKWTRLVAGFQGETKIGSEQLFSSAFQDVVSTVKHAARRIRSDQGDKPPSINTQSTSQTVTKQHNLQLVSCIVKWVSPLQQVTARLRVKGLAFNLDLTVLSSVIEWVRSLMAEFDRVKNGYNIPAVVREDVDLLNVRVDHIVVEAIDIRLSVRAPPRRLQENAWMRLLGLMVSAESANGLEVQLPRVVFNGDFFGVDGVFERIEAMYLRAMTSGHVVRQITRQLPRFVRIAQVMGTCFLRRRDVLLTNHVESTALLVEREGRQTDGIGLLGAIVEQRGVQLMRASWEDRSALVPFVRGRDNSGNGAGGNCLATVDITR